MVTVTCLPSVIMHMCTRGVVTNYSTAQTWQAHDYRGRRAYLLADFPDGCHTRLLLGLHAPSRDNPSVWMATAAHK